VTTEISPPTRAGIVRGTLLSSLSAIAFGLSGPFGKVAFDAGLSPVRVTTARIVLTAVLLAAFVLPTRGLPRLRGGGWRVLLGYSLLCVIGSPLLFFIAVARIPVGVAMVLEFLAPVLVALWIRFVRGTRLPAPMWLGTALALIGLAMVAQVFDGLRLDLVGVLAGLGAAVCTAGYYLLGEHAASTGDPLSLTAGSMLLGAVLISVVSPPWTISLSSLEKPSQFGPIWLALVLLAVICTAFAYAAGILALRHLPSSVAAVLGLIEPVVATLASRLVLGQVLTVVQVIGAVVLLGGAAIVQLTSGRRTEPEALPEL
jgi:drug/metabolite transporter (DMT)-like permease